MLKSFLGWFSRSQPAAAAPAAPQRAGPSPDSATSGEVLTPQPLLRVASVRAVASSAFSMDSRFKKGRVPDRLGPGLPALVDGFPEYPNTRVPEAPFVDCKIYYGVYTSFSVEQRRYYVYWRQEFDAGRTIRATETMLFVAAYEAAVFRTTLESVVDRWIQLWRAYPEAHSFRHYCSGWVDDVRAIAGSNVYDDLSRGLPPGSARFDAAVRAGLPPDLHDVMAMFSAGEIQYGAVPAARVQRAMAALRETQEGDPILVAALREGPSRLKRAEAGRLLRGYFTADHLAPYFPEKWSVSTWYMGAGARKAARALFKEAMALVSTDYQTRSLGTSTDPGMVMVDVPGEQHRQPIRRSKARRTAAPEFDTVEGLQFTLHVTADDSMLMLFGLVLHLCDVKPYIEGQIAYARPLRVSFERAAKALEMETGLGHFRQSFYYLASGARAPWTLEPAPSHPGAMQMGELNARFVRGLQRALLGSDPRGSLYRWVVDQLATRRQKTAAEVVAGFEAATGVQAPAALGVIR